MNKSNRFPFLLSVILLGVLISLFQNCSSGVEFGSIEAKDFSSETHEEGNSLYRTVETFTTITSGTEQELDILWVVDNSRSMKEEADHVQENLDQFIDHLSGTANVKLALISASKRDSHRGVSLSYEARAAGMIQINEDVSSHSALEDILDHQYELLNYFRPNSAKAFVIVTDDNSSIGTHQFMHHLHKDLSNNLRTYGFIAFDKFTSPCRANRGSVYEDLSSATEGSVYNICEKDWSDHFNNLMNRVGSQVGNNRFKFKHRPEEIEQVKLNGQVLQSHQYSIINNDTLLIAPSLLHEVRTHKVEVTYSHH